HIQRLMPDIQGVLYQPVDTEKFNTYPLPIGSPPESLNPILQSGARIILNTSRITQPGIFNDKNLPALIPVLAHLRKQGYPYHVLLIGEIWPDCEIWVKELIDAAQKAGVADYFTVLPGVFDIETYYKYANVMVTLAPREPFGRAVVEAIASGVPVVGSRTGGIGEILSHFAPEWAVDPTDPIAAAAAILRIAEDPNTPNQLMAGQEWINQECSVSSYAQKIMKITGISPQNPVKKQIDMETTHPNLKSLGNPGLITGQQGGINS
ncbi:MAG: glycosyltransferase, partial [Kovacikia sp.]